MPRDPSVPDEFEILLQRQDGRSVYLELAGDRLLWYHESVAGMAPLEARPEPERWRRFWAAVEECGLWEWDSQYNVRDCPVPEITGWRARVALGGRRVEARAALLPDAATAPRHPLSFPRFVDAVQDLLGS